MKIKKWQIILAATLAILVIAALPLAALAAENETAARPVRPLYGGLEMVAPHAAPVDKEFSLQVFARQTLEPAAGAGVWAISKGNAETAKNELKALKQANPDPAEAEIAAVLNKHGFLMGRTVENGKLSYTFTETGTYVMIAFKAHYWPDWNVIVIGSGALSITAPRRAAPGENISIAVTGKADQAPVEGAGIWAIGKDDITGVKEKIAALRTAGQLRDADIDSILKPHGSFLGKTDSSGKLTCAFTATGRYLLVAMKKGYIPGLGVIAVVAPVTAENTDATIK